ncbi:MULTISPECIES: thioesterase family protein [unclassified Arthrobacter]|uniref:thioesterase family protein n=1 Tax=unclassified Arthrobacter TaxID=235627 RepID=UPI0004171839|nr:MULTISPECIES: thioesterase family protein [unclassified Arthrobacter]PVE19365.1 thioesterase family protein [Arthrobacter sp. Bz4]
MPASYYRPLGEGSFESTIHAQGAWNPEEQHMAPAAGLLAHCLEQCSPRPDLRMARLSFDILGMIPGGTFDVLVKVIRPGKTIELLEAEMVSGGRTVIRAKAWRLAKADSAAVAAIEDAPMPGPDQAGPFADMTAWPGGFIESLEFRVVEGHRPGRGRVWLRTPHQMVEGTPTADLVRLIGLIDTANGVSARVPPGPGSWMFPNLDLQVHLYREPAGEWLGLETSVSFGADGIGLTSAVLHDTTGPFGRAEQILTIRKL